MNGTVRECMGQASLIWMVIAGMMSERDANGMLEGQDWRRGWCYEKDTQNHLLKS